MKKLALLFCGLGSMFALSLNAADVTSAQPEPQYQEQCVPAPCAPDTVCNQLPCNVPDTVCNPAPCVNPAPCDNPAPAESTPAQTTVVNGCC